MFRLNFKIALRNLWKNKGYTLINVGGLAIGLASCMILLLYVAYEWGYDRQSSNYQHTYIVYNHTKTSSEIFSHTTTPGVMAPEIKAVIPGVAAVTHYSYPQDHLLSYKYNSMKKQGMFTDSDFLKIMDYDFIKGNMGKALRETNSVILTETMARNMFGNEDPINKVIKLDNLEPLKVEAVIADLPKNSSFAFDYLMTWKLYEQLQPNILGGGYGNNFCETLVQLKGPDSYDKANELVARLYEKNRKEKLTRFELYPIAKLHLYDKFENGKSVGGKIEQIRIFFMLAFCILLIACVNFMNLSTARSEKRAKEVGVRKAIGSTRKSLMGQFMLESMLLALLGMVVAFVLMELSLPYFNRVLNVELFINYTDWKFWGALTGLSLFTGVIAGSYPAFYLSSFEPLQVLKGIGLNTGKSSLSVRQVLVVFQFVFAACLIICTAVIYQQLSFVKNKSIGYNKNNLVEIPLDGPLLNNEAKLKLVQDQLLKSGGATGVSFFSTSLSQNGNNTFSVKWPGKIESDMVLFNNRAAGYDFVKTAGTALVSGREFSRDYVDTANVILDEAAVRIMGLKNPVGAKIEVWDEPVTVIGVVKDFTMESPYKETKPMFLYNNMKQVTTILLRLNEKESVSTSMEKITAAMEALNPGFPVEVKFADDNFEKKFKDEKLLGTVANWFGGFAIFISCLGLLGLALYMAEQRKKEISIRKVLGASNMNILTLLNKDFIKLVAVANLIAFPVAYVIINHWLSEFSYRVPISVLPFALALSLSVIIAILTVSVQSVKVAKANPVDALKYE